MRFTSVLLSAILLTTAGLSSAFAASGKMEKHTFSNSAGSRTYYVYAPQGARERGPMPLMVMLHGCSESAQAFADLTGMNDVADKEGFVVLYPEQPSSANPLSCWNWFKPENQTRGGELSLVAGMVEETGKTLNIDPNKIYAAGLSAGAAMASNLIACYADIFSGAAIHDGLAFRAATSENAAWMANQNGSTEDPNKSGVDAAKCTGAEVNPVAIVVFHGTADYLVNKVNAEQIVAQFSKMNDILDDGVDNSSQSATAISTEKGQVPSGHTYQASLYGGDSQAHIEKVLVDGMRHAWSGGKGTSGPFSFADPKGPNASEMIWNFLSTHSMPRQK